MLNSQRFAQCGHLWPSSVFKHSPVDGFQIFTNPSSLPLASSPAIDHATSMTPLPFPQMSGNTYVVVVYAPGESRRQNRYLNGFAYAMAQNKQRYLWPSSVVRHLPDSTSQILRVSSQDADTMVLP